MPRPSPYPPLELDFEEISSSGLRHAPTAEPTTAPSDKRHTIAPEFDIEAFAREAMSDENGPVSGATAPEAPTSEVRAVTDTAKTAPPPPPSAHDSLYPDKSDVRGSVNPLVTELRDLLTDKDYRAALVVADQILEDDPDNKPAKAGRKTCHDELEKLYIARLGSLEQVPTVAVSPREVPNLALDHRSGFILALVDGVSTLDMILDMASMPRLDALRVLLELVQHGTLTLG